MAYAEFLCNIESSTKREEVSNSAIWSCTCVVRILALILAHLNARTHKGVPWSD